MSDICFHFVYSLTLVIICSIYTTPRRTDEPATTATARPIQAIHPHALQASMPSVDPLNTYPFQVYAPPPPQPIHGAPPRGMTNAQPQPWQVTIAPAQAHLHPPPPPHPHMMHRPPAGPSQPGSSQHYREDAWDGYNTPDEMAAQPTAYEFRYRDEQSGWVPGPGPYYEPSVPKFHGFLISILFSHYVHSMNRAMDNLRTWKSLMSIPRLPILLRGNSRLTSLSLSLARQCHLQAETPKRLADANAHAYRLILCVITVCMF